MSISPSSEFPPSAIPPTTLLLPQPSQPPQSSPQQDLTIPPESSSPPQLPIKSSQAKQTDANPPETSFSPPNALSPTNLGPPVVVSSPPPSDPSPPPPPPDVFFSPPPTNPPEISPPPLSLPIPPTIPPPSPPLATPPTNFPSPPLSNSPPTPPTPPSSESPVVSPPPPLLKPPENSPPSPISDAHQSSTSPPESPSYSKPDSPPAHVSHNSPPSFLGPPVPHSRTTTTSSNRLRARDSSFNSSKAAKGSNGGIGSGGAAAIGVLVVVLVFVLIGLMAFWIIKRRKKNPGANIAYVMPSSLGSSPRSDTKLVEKTGYPSPPFRGNYSSDAAPIDHVGFAHSKHCFTYQELLDATDGFSAQNLLGEGGFGYVYKGVLPDGREVAVKQLKLGSGQGQREFQAEVEIISRIHHRHLVSLVGYCILESKRLLVYEYVSNDTLYFHLHGKGKRAMDWATRVKIAIGAAHGIAYLHEDCHPRVIHRDIKSSNILLDSNFEARVADFGLARLAMDADTHVSTRVMGTFGYLAPEYATSGKLSEKSDVYSFGVVLLELITGRKPVDESQPLGDESLVEWARPLLTHVLETGDFESLVDPWLEKNYVESEMFRMIEAAAACVRHSSSKRPRMGQVVRALDGISDSGDLSNGLRVGESRMYNSAEQSAEIRWFRRVAFGSRDISSGFFDQNSGYPHQSGQNSNFTARQGQNGNFSTEHSQSSQSLGFSTQSRQNANISAGGISRPQNSSVDFSDQRQY